MTAKGEASGTRRVSLTIVDTMAPRAYSDRQESLVGLGGTEATVASVAMALGVPVDVRQAARASVETRGAVRFAPLDLLHPLPGDPPHIVVINSWKVALKVRRHHPTARIDVWPHVYPGRHNRAMGRALAEAGITCLCVSACHARHMREWSLGSGLRVDHIANPIADALRPDATPRDPDLLVFASSPHKGIGQVFRAFEAARAEIPSLRLVVADPGYLRWPRGPVPGGVELVGRLVGVRDQRLQLSGSLANLIANADLKQARLLDQIDDFIAEVGIAALAPDRPSPTVVDTPPTSVDVAAFDTVLWATGNRYAPPQLDACHLDRRGRVVHDGGLLRTPGLFAIGLPFLRRRSSTFLSGIGRDAVELAVEIRRHLEVSAAAA